MIKHKFHAKQTVLDNIRFQSKKEANYYLRLKALKAEGKILFFLRQTSLHLDGNTKYVVDFVEFWAPTDSNQGDVIFTDVKGFMTPMARLKITQSESRYNIKINIV